MFLSKIYIKIIIKFIIFTFFSAYFIFYEVNYHFYKEYRSNMRLEDSRRKKDSKSDTDYLRFLQRMNIKSNAMHQDKFPRLEQLRRDKRNSRSSVHRELITKFKNSITRR